MKFFRLMLVLFVVGTAVQVKAQGEASQNPALKDYKEVIKFREVFYPLVNKYLPEHNYEAILNAAPVLKTAAIEYSKMKYDTHHNMKLKAFNGYRDSLSIIVKAYEDAALQFDTTTVCKLLPPMTDQFEKSANMLIPYSWQEYTDLRLTVEKLYNFVINEKKKLPTEKVDPVRMMDTISVQMTTFIASPGPQEVHYRDTLITEEKTYFSKLVDQIKKSLAAGDKEKFRTKVMELKVRLVTFERFYLQ